MLLNMDKDHKNWRQIQLVHPKAMVEFVYAQMPERLIRIYKERRTRYKYDSVIDNMTGAIFFSKTEKGIMRLKRLCYGINNSFQIFQRAIHQSLGNKANTKFISSDIIIYTKTLQEYIITIKKLFEKLRDLNLKLNRKKIPFFGVILLSKGIQPDPTKLIFLQNGSPSKYVTELRTFLKFRTYSSRFFENVSEKTAILRRLLKENVKYTWTDTHQQCV